MTTTRTNPRFDQRSYDRLTVQAAIGRMAPDDDKLRATIEAFDANTGRPAYWRLLVHTLAMALNTIQLVHAVECDRAGCRTCWAISLAATAIAAHQTIDARGGAQ
jgi:hypothetical protein